MGTSVALGDAAVTVGALADGVATADAAGLDAGPAADDVPGVQADSASPTPRPRAERPAISLKRVKCLKFIVCDFYGPDGSGVTMDDGWDDGWGFSSFHIAQGAVRRSPSGADEPVSARCSGRCSWEVTRLIQGLWLAGSLPVQDGLNRADGALPLADHRKQGPGAVGDA